MNFFSRVSRLVQTQVKALQSPSESPEEALERLVAEMELELIELRRALAAAIAQFKSTERQRHHHDLWAQRWYDRAQTALAKGQEAQAREALTHRQSHQAQAETLDGVLTEHRQLIERFRQDLQRLEGAYQRLKTQKSLYLTRLKSAIAAQKLAALSHPLDPRSASALWERLEEQILTLEAEKTLLTPAETALEAQFQALENPTPRQDPGTISE